MRNLQWSRSAFIICLFLLPLFPYCQFRIFGEITDSSGRAISSASVSIINLNNQAGYFFDRSDEKGIYHFTIPDSLFKLPLAVRVNAIGFSKSLKPLHFSISRIDFSLSPEIKELPAVTVMNTNSNIRIKGDTLDFIASNYSDKNDRSIEDVIKKIPGIEIDGNGTIKYQGRGINYFYIDGDNILDNKYSLATKNIPNDFVEKIQLIENNQHIKILNGIVASESPAINITLKDKAKTNFINTTMLVVGTEAAKEAEVNSLAFKSKFKAINIAKYNNTGNDPGADLNSHNPAEFSAAIVNSGLNNLLSMGITGPPDIKKSRVLFNNAGLVNINDFIKTKHELTFRINAYYLFDKQDQKYESYTDYYLPADTIHYIENQQLQKSLQNLHAVINTNINSAKRYLNYSLSFDLSSTNDFADLITTGNSIKQTLNTTVKTFSNNLNGIKLLRNGKYIEYFSFIGYETKPQALVISPGLHQEQINSNIPFAQSTQYANVPLFFTNNYVSFKKNNRILFQSYKAGILIQNANINSSISLLQNDNVLKQVSDSFINQLHWKKRNIYGEAEYRLDVGQTLIRLTIPVTNTFIHFSNYIFKNTPDINRFIITPALYWRYKTGKENTVSAGYHYDTRLSNINEVFSGAIMNNYQSFISNDLPIQQIYINSYTAGFDFRKSIKLLFINISANYVEKKAEFMYSSFFRNNIIKRIAVPISNTTYISYLSSGISKYLFSLKSNIYLRHSIQYTRNQQLQNNLLFPISVISNNLTVGVTLKPNKYISANYEVLQIWSSVRTNENSSTNLKLENTYYSKQQLELNIFLSEPLSLKFKNEYYYNKSHSQTSRSYFFADGSIRYGLKNNNTDLELTYLNITNSNLLSEINISANSISGSNYVLRPRMLAFRVSFRF